MYIDGHEHKDVVEYQNGFLKHWEEYEKCMVTYDNDRNVDVTHWVCSASASPFSIDPCHT